MESIIFQAFKIGDMLLKNRLVRSATYEGACDGEGLPSASYKRIYTTLAKNEVGMIITGFAFTTEQGRAMQPAQAGINSRDNALSFREVTDAVHEQSTKIIMQIAHTGRQTLKGITKLSPVSSSRKRSIYFREKPKLIRDEEIESIINSFAQSALFAKEAGFDGVQLHAAHGYLIHQFLLPQTNILKNKYGINMLSGLGTEFLSEVIDRVRSRCGESFPLLVKISGNHDLARNFYPQSFDNLILFLTKKKIDAIEISYGTMDYPLNIFRGELNLDPVFEHNPIYKKSSIISRKLKELYLQTFISPKFKPFTPAYNLDFAGRAKQLTGIPVISVGGFRRKSEIENAIREGKTDLAAMSRPFICEPDFAKRIRLSPGDYVSQCKNCNECVFMCDSGRITTCYSRKNN